MVAKHGTLGLILFTAIACDAGLFACVGVGGIALLVASGGASFAHWTLAIAIGGQLYSMARLAQIVPTRPTKADIAFLDQAQHGTASADKR